MKEIVEGILKFLSELTPKRVMGLIVFIGLFVFAVNVYEYYTGSFECKKIERTINLLEKLHNLDQAGILSNQCLNAAYLVSIERTEAVLNKKISLSLPIKSCAQQSETSVSWWQRGFASSWLWLFFAMCVIPGIVKGKTEDKSALGGFLVFAGLIWIIGGFIPAVWWPWFHAGVLTVLQLLILVAIVVLGGKKKKK